MFDIRLENITKKFDAFTAVNNVTFTVPKSSVTVLLGPSGCGKTTLMRMIAGLESPTEGKIFFDNHEVTNVSTKRRNIGMVFQYPVIYRGTSVRRNLELPLLSENLSKAEITKRVDEVAELLGLTDVLKRFVEELDNGTRQKIAVGREVARQTKIILFDEPITNIDLTSKLELKRSMKELFSRLQQTIVYVTHDQTEAMTLADQIALMQDGVITQSDSPKSIYEKPNSQFAGWFLGNPGMNFVPPQFIKIAGTKVTSTMFSQTIELGSKAVAADTFGVRAEGVTVSTSEVKGGVKAKVTRKSIGAGGQYLLDLAIENLLIKARVPHSIGKSANDSVWTTIDSESITFFDKSGNTLT
jgi:ABC-type sugar transport system ATPase subunit